MAAVSQGITTVVVGQDGESPFPLADFLRYVRERNVLTLPEAIHKMSGLPAEHMGFTDRGILRPGMKADLVLFDAKTVIDRSTREAPREVSSGIERVWVNGEVVYEEGQTTGRFPGEVIRRE